MQEDMNRLYKAIDFLESLEAIDQEQVLTIALLHDLTKRAMRKKNIRQKARPINHDVLKELFTERYKGEHRN